MLSYDQNGWVTNVTEPFGVVLSFAYDDLGNRTLVTDNFGGTQSSVYDADSRLLTLTYTGESQTLSETLTYFNDGIVNTAALYSGATLIETTTDSDAGNGQVSSILDQYADGSTLASFEYAYNTLDQLTSTTENGTAVKLQLRPGRADDAGGSQSYSYNPNGSPNNTGDSTGANNELSIFVDSSGDTWNYLCRTEL